MSGVVDRQMWCRTMGWRVWKCDREVAGGETAGPDGSLREAVRDGAWMGGAKRLAGGNEGLPGEPEVFDVGIG